jgi:hypothetical protein
MNTSTTLYSSFFKQLTGSVFAELQNALIELPDGVYSKPCPSLSNATIGQHARHIIELFQCLETGYETGLVNYEKRKRDLQIEQDKTVAIALLGIIINGLDKQDKDLTLQASFGDGSVEVNLNSNYYREVAYNLEHTIHHMALIRVGIKEFTTIVLPDSFGVAPSTIQYRKACAQ